MSGISVAPCLIALPESHPLAAAVAAEDDLPLIRLEERRFEGGEFKLRPLDSVRGRTVFVLQSLAGTGDSPVCERLLRLLFLLQGLRDAGAGATVAVLPYLAFARKDRRTQVRDPVSSRYVAQLLEAAGVAQVIALDVHNPAAFDNAFRIPTVHLTALPMMVDHFARQAPASAFAVVSPDIGGIKRAQIFRELLAARTGREVELAFIEKRRARGVVVTGMLVGEVAGRAVVLIDDLCATGGTLIRAAKICHSAGADVIHAAVAHAPLAAGLGSLLAAEAIATVVVTDSTGIDSVAERVPPTAAKQVTLRIAPLLALTLRRLLAGDPLAPLLEHWPPQ
jgi:ribose-phosphate pyrophosphokinase